MRGNVDAIKERLDIVEVVSTYLKLDKAGQSYKGKCPFHNEKTASFFVSPARQSYYCFGCGAKGDIFTMVQEMEGVDFRGALKILADRAGIELEYQTGESKSEKDRLYAALEDATSFFQNELEKNAEAKKYLASRGISEESIKEWRLGFVPEEWRSLFSHLTAVGYSKDILLKAGLIKQGEEKNKEPYDVFRGRIIFPLFDSNGRVIAFSGRALAKDAVAKYLNSPDTPLFTKSDVLYGLDKAKEDIRRKNYAVLVEGQMDLVLSHQAGVKNTVASSGTAFTQMHLERLKKLSARIILAFDGDEAGGKAAEKSAVLGLSLGMEVKIAKLPEDKDPADVVKSAPDEWKETLRSAVHAIEYALAKALESETDRRKAGKSIEKKVLPLLALLSSSIERAHFVSLIAKRSGIREEIIWEDLRKAKTAPVPALSEEQDLESKPSRTSRAQELEEVEAWLKEKPDDSKLLSNRIELQKLMRIDELADKIESLYLSYQDGDEEVLPEIVDLQKRLDEEKRKIV